jgi:cephalosporin-C deacetylase
MSIPTTHPYDFDPTAGMTLAELQAVEPPPAPPEFDAFWQAKYRATLGLDPAPSLRLSADGHPDWRIYDIAYVSTGGFPIKGWLMLPRHGRVRRGLVVGHGYGGRDGPDFDIPVEETAILFPCFRGLSRSARAPISPDPAWHVLHDIDRRDSYILGGCVEDLWMAVSALVMLYPWLSGHVGYSGISFGGGIGALAIPYDNRIDCGYLALPTFGDRPLWNSLPSVGSAEAVQAYLRKHPAAIETLSYFDAAVAAARIAVPMLFAVALFDPAVAPPCQFAVANAPKKFKEIFILDAGHFDYDRGAVQQEVLRDRLRIFLRGP